MLAVQARDIPAPLLERLLDSRSVLPRDVLHLLCRGERSSKRLVYRIEDITAGDACCIGDVDRPVRQRRAPDRHPRKLETYRRALRPVLLYNRVRAPWVLVAVSTDKGR